MKGNFHVRFLEELGRVIAPSYSAGGWKASALLYYLRASAVCVYHFKEVKSASVKRREFGNMCYMW